MTAAKARKINLAGDVVMQDLTPLARFLPDVYAAAEEILGRFRGGGLLPSNI